MKILYFGHRYSLHESAGNIVITLKAGDDTNVQNSSATVMLWYRE